MIRDHTAAIKALLVAELPSTTEVHVSRAAGPAPYVVLHPDTGRGEPTSLGGDTDERRWYFTTHTVGVTTEQTQLVAESVWAALLDVTPDIPGRVCHPIRSDASPPVDEDTDGTVSVYIARDVWLLVTRPA